MPSTSRSRGTGRGPDSAPRSQVLAPMSERQQLALVMQISSQDVQPAAPTPPEEKKRTRQQRNEHGETPLHVASIRGDHEQVKKLLEQGQEPDVHDFAGWTPLHEACSFGWFNVVEVLVNGGANVNAKGLDDDTPLHDAITAGNLKMVTFLIEKGADPYLKNGKGRTPADCANEVISEYLQSLKHNNVKNTHSGSTRDDSNKKVGNASGNKESGKRSNMDGLAQGDHFDGKDNAAQEKGSNAENKDEGTQLTASVMSSAHDESAGNPKRLFAEDSSEADGIEDDKKKRRKDNDDKEPMAKPAPISRGQGRVLTGNKLPGPASKTSAVSMGKGASVQNVKGSSGTSGGKGMQGTGKGSGGGTKGKSSGGAKGSSGSQSNKDRKSPVASPKPSQSKDGFDGDIEEQKTQESSAPKVPPIKIVLPGGASGSGNRNEQEGEGGTGQRGSGKGRGSVSSLPYIIPCTSNDPGQASDSSDGNSDDKRLGDIIKAGQRVLRSHRTNDGENEKDKERISPHTSSDGRQNALNSNKSPPPSTSGHDAEHGSSTSNNAGRSESGSGHSEVHPRKRKLKASKDSHSRDQAKSDSTAESSIANHIAHSNPYQMYIHIRKQLEHRRKSLVPVKPKPPKDFNKYLMNRCTYTLQSNVNPEPQIEIPMNLPPQMVNEFTSQEKERTRLRIQHLIEKEKLVLAVEQEILRVHGRAERAVGNQTLPFSVCTVLRDKEVYNLPTTEHEEKRNAQRSRCNGRQIKSWLQEVDDKWEKIKEEMLRRQHTEADSLHAVQTMGWEWKLKELGICDYKTTPKIDTTHVPKIHVSNFDLPA